MITVTNDVADEILLNVWDKEDNNTFSINMNAVMEEIHKHAYYKWEAAGCPIGQSLCFWLEAEEEICDLLGLYFSR